MTVIDPEQWVLVSALFDEAVELSDDLRSAWLARLEVEQPLLAKQVRLLLDDHEASAASRFLTGGKAFGHANPLDADPVGQTLGPYVLESALGRGGMGSVWLAHRSDGRYVGSVAIKMLDAALIGQSGGERFKREAQILARLTHPHIARLLDAGVSEAGQPYLVLEHVSGQPIDRHCDDLRLSTNARIGLFLEVLAAVAYSHAHLIVHRDLKPLNVLVDKDGGAKLLDFGIAKLIADDLLVDDPVALTKEDGRALTPDYAAPEQLLGQSVTIATDVYALGVLLYVLLSGLHPAGRGHRSIAQLVKATVDEEPPLMSVAATSLEASERDAAGAHAAMRSATPKSLRQVLAGDLDTIVAKALRKSPSERYATVDALADDLRRHLAHLPVHARPATVLYRFSRFATRHRAGVFVGGLGALAIVAGVIGTVTESLRATEQARRAEQSAQQAKHERDRALQQLTYAEATDEFLSFLLQEESGKPFTTAQLLARGQQLVDKQFAYDAPLRVRMLLTLANLYSEDMEQTKSKDLYLRAQSAASGVADTSIQSSVECGLAERLGDENSFDQAAALFDRAITRLQAIPDKDTALLASCFSSRSMVDTLRGDPRAARTDAQAALNYLGTPRPGQRGSAIIARQALADAQGDLGQERLAVEEYDATLQELIGMGRGNTMLAINVLNSLGVRLSRSGQWKRALETYQSGMAVASQNERAAAIAPSLATNYSKLLVEMGRTDEAKTRFEAAMAEVTRRGHVRSIGPVWLIASTAWCASGDLVRCDALLGTARKQIDSTLPPGHSMRGTLDTVEAQLALEQGQPALAREHLVHALSIFDAAADKNPSRLRAAALLATAELQLGDRAAALIQAERAVQQARDALGGFASSAWLGEALLVKGKVQKESGDASGAAASWRDAFTQLQQTLGDDAPATKKAAELLQKG